MERKTPPSRNPRDPRSGSYRPDPRGAPERPAARTAPAAPSPAVLKAGVPHGATESGWLPDCVYTGEKFESGLAFFADSVGRITRFSREPADLTAARRLAGQAALPGLVNTHSHVFHRVMRGRIEQRGRAAQEPMAAWHEAMERGLDRLNGNDIFDTARMAFMEMLLAGITCVGEFHYLHRQADGSPWPDANFAAREIVRAAHDVGIRIALLNVAYARANHGAAPDSGPARFQSGPTDPFLRDTEALRVAVEKDYPADEAWLGTGAYSLAAVPLDAMKAISSYARAQRLRFHCHVSTRAEDNVACRAEFGKTAIALLADHGVIDKRFTAVDGVHLTDDEVKLLGTARAGICACPISDRNFARRSASAEKILAAGAGLAFGTDSQVQIDLLKDSRLLEYDLRAERGTRSVIAPDSAKALFHAATFTGARSLGATSGALEVGRPADFFTVNLFDPSIAGSDPESLLANVVFALERRAIRDVWIGARQRIAGGRHIHHGPIVGRFVEVQKRLWSG